MIDCSLPKDAACFQGKTRTCSSALVFTGTAAADEHLAIPDDQKTIAVAVEIAKKADVAILALGESTNWMEGEAASRTALGFTGAQEQLLEAVVATGKPVVLVVLAGRPLELKWASEHVPAILKRGVRASKPAPQLPTCSSGT